MLPCTDNRHLMPPQAANTRLPHGAEGEPPYRNGLLLYRTAIVIQDVGFIQEIGERRVLAKEVLEF